MALSRGDDFPIHQTPEPIAFAQGERNFYDRYFFNGYAPDAGEDFFALAFGVYPALDIADASFSIVRDGRQVDLHASRWLAMERMALEVGPIAIEVIEPLRRLKLKVESPKEGVKAELVFAGRAFPIEEPRFTRRAGPRLVMDYTRLTQNGRWRGWVELDGVRRNVSGFVGTRDRSWGVRPVGEREPQPTPRAQPPQFFWLWGPANMSGGSFFFHTNDDAAGAPWNRRAVWARDGASVAEQTEFAGARFAIDWRKGTRQAAQAVIALPGPHAREVVYEPQACFLMRGLGYGHPQWGHGMAHGETAVAREEADLAKVDWANPEHLHIQALCKVTDRPAQGEESFGRGVLEQLVIGPHAPTGFAETLDLAK